MKPRQHFVYIEAMPTFITSFVPKPWSYVNNSFLPWRIDWNPCEWLCLFEMILILPDWYDCRCIDDFCQTSICLLKKLIWGFEFFLKWMWWFGDVSIKRTFEGYIWNQYNWLCVFEMILILPNQYECRCFHDRCFGLFAKMLIWGFEFNSQKGCSSVNDALIMRNFFSPNWCSYWRWC